FGSDGFPDRANLLIRFLVAARHQGRSPERAFFTAGHTRADQVEALTGKLFLSSNGIHEIGVATIDDNVALLQIRFDLSYGGINSFTRFHQKNDFPRSFQALNETLLVLLAQYGLSLTARVDELIDLIGTAIVDSDGKSVAFD